MGFWIFMLIVDLFIPIIMIAAGSIYIKRPPKDINGSSGYKTAMARKNIQTWTFAHHYFGRLWRIVGYVLLVLSVAAMIFIFGKSTEAVGLFGGVLCGVQVIVMLCPVIPTEAALRKNFDKNGRRRR